jgi:lysophospholipase L1-like esterase
METGSAIDRETFRKVASTIALALLLVHTGGTYSQTRIMPLGDSITEGVWGSSDDTGYRRALYLSLIGASYSVNFVGSRVNGTPTDFDRDHEGHSGWRADQILNGRPGEGNISSWLTTNPADIILLHIGTNDISQGQSVSSTVTNVRDILDRIDAKSTATEVFLARIINRTDGYSAATTTYNIQLQALANTRIANGDLITVVDQEAALNYSSDLADVVHPNDAGYAKMAQCWFTPVSSYLTPVPVQLSSFTGKIVNRSEVRLEWTTLTETNNYGFEVQRSANGGDRYLTLPNGFVPGRGTSLVPHSYSYSDATAGSGAWYYRLKQIDLDGTVHYSEGVRLDIVASVKNLAPLEFALLQNYPNPFNPSTTINYQLPTDNFVTVKVYDPLGREIAVLVNEQKDAGHYSVQFDGLHLSSGVYFYRLSVVPLARRDLVPTESQDGQVGTFIETKKLLLLR